MAFSPPPLPLRSPHHHPPTTTTTTTQTHLTSSKSTHHLKHLPSFCATSPRADPSYAHHPRTTSTYNLLIRRASLNRSRDPKSTTMSLYQDLLRCGLYPDTFTFTRLIKALADCRALPEGRLVHAHVVKMGFESESYIRNCLIWLYCSCGEMLHARKVFDRFPDRDLVSWTTLISGYSKLGLPREAVSVFVEMVDVGLRPDAVVVTAVLSACARLGDLELGRRLRGYIDARDVDCDVFVVNALVDMYAKCGDVKSAYDVFRGMRERNVVSWNSMISGLAKNGEFREALSLFRRMQREGLEPDGVTLVAVLSSCAHLGALELGEWLHSYMEKAGIRADGIVGNAVVDMYAKCGRIDQAIRVFDAMTQRDVYAYTSMVVGLAMHGRAEEALDLFSKMSRARVKPNGITFIGVLSACSHAGLVDVGLNHFCNMSRVYGITPQVEHYGCVVDMLGRAGSLDAAQEFVNRMPIKPDAFIWGALLGACTVHGNVILGARVAKKLFEMEPGDDGAYVLMSNLYASANHNGAAKQIRKTMKSKKVKKTPGCSLIEVDGIVHEFRMQDKSCRREVYMVAEEMGNHLESEGCNVLT